MPHMSHITIIIDNILKLSISMNHGTDNPDILSDIKI